MLAMDVDMALKKRKDIFLVSMTYSYIYVANKLLEGGVKFAILSQNVHRTRTLHILVLMIRTKPKTICNDNSQSDDEFSNEVDFLYCLSDYEVVQAKTQSISG